MTLFGGKLLQLSREHKTDKPVDNQTSYTDISVLDLFEWTEPKVSVLTAKLHFRIIIVLKL